MTPWSSDELDLNSTSNQLDKPQWNIEVFYVEQAKSNVIIVPWIPNYWINDGLIAYFHSIGSNIFFINNWISSSNIECLLWELLDGDELDNGLTNIIIGFSYWAWVAARYIENEKISMLLALSPLLWNTGTDEIDWNKLLNSVVEDPGENSVDSFRRRVLSSIENNPHILNHDKIRVLGIFQDTMIDLSSCWKAVMFEEWNLWFSHFWIRKTWCLSRDQQSSIFQSVESYNISESVERFVLNTILEEVWEGNITWITTHGSNAFQKDVSWKNDADFIIVFKKNNETTWENFLSAKHKILKQFSWIDFDFSIFFEDSIKELWLKSVVTSTHWPTYNIFFSNSKIIFWENIFSDAEAIFSETEVQKSSLLEIWKYVDRFNRLLTRNELTYSIFLKYLCRSIMCYQLSCGRLSYLQTNNYSTIEAIEFMSKSLIKSKEYFQYFTWILSWDIKEENFQASEGIRFFNNFLKDIWRPKPRNIGSIETAIRSSVNIPWYKQTIFVHPNILQSTESNLLSISCLWFERLNVLSDTESLTEDQENKWMVTSIIFNKMQHVFDARFWITIIPELKIWDFWLKLEGEVKDIISRIRTQINVVTNNIPLLFSWNVSLSKLSEDLMSPWEAKFTQNEVQNSYCYEDFYSILSDSRYSLWEDFIDNYLNMYFDKNKNFKNEKKLLPIIYNSISEHLELAYRMTEKWENKIILYIGNEQKLALMKRVIANSPSNTNSFIWISRNNI